MKETTRLTIQFDLLLAESQIDLLCELIDKYVSEAWVMREQIVEVEE